MCDCWQFLSPPFSFSLLSSGQADKQALVLPFLVLLIQTMETPAYA